jgi:hypothetical protein
LPVIRQMILTCSPLGSGSAPPSSRAHNSPPVTVPRTSGGPPAPCHGVDGDGGLQPGPPNWPPATGVVGLEEGVETFEGDAEAPGGPVWQAVRTPARSIPATILTISLLQRRGSARSAYPSIRPCPFVVPLGIMRSGQTQCTGCIREHMVKVISHVETWDLEALTRLLEANRPRHHLGGDGSD